jgi:Domain of unknown function (DUF4190)
MKRCPTCRQAFFDEALSFCTDDGTPLLVEDAPPDFRVTESNPDPPATVLSADPQATWMLNDQQSQPGVQPQPTPQPQPSWPSQESTAATRPYAPRPTPGPAGSFGNTPNLGQMSGPAAPAPAEWSPPPPPNWGGAVSSQQQQQLSVVALVFGLISITIGWFCGTGLLAGAVAIGTGIYSLVQIKKDPVRYGGKPMAIIGIVLGSLYYIIYLGIILVYIILVAIGLSTSR